MRSTTLHRTGGLAAALVVGTAGAVVGVPAIARALDGSPATASIFVPVTPARLLDTRAGKKTVDGQAQAIGKRGAASTYALTVGGRGGIPADATAVVLNVTAVGASTPTYITAYPDGSARPGTSTLNPSSKNALANLTTVGLGSGKVDLYNAAGTTDLLVDVTGYYTASGLVSKLQDAAASARPVSAQASTSVSTQTTGGGIVSGLTINTTVPSAGVLELTVDTSVWTNFPVNSGTTAFVNSVYAALCTQSAVIVASSGQSCSESLEVFFVKAAGNKSEYDESRPETLHLRVPISSAGTYPTYLNVSSSDSTSPGGFYDYAGITADFTPTSSAAVSGISLAVVHPAASSDTTGRRQ